jgi:hypothetical protein
MSHEYVTTRPGNVLPIHRWAPPPENDLALPAIRVAGPMPFHDVFERMNMETAPILFLFGFALSFTAGVHFRGRSAKAAGAKAAQRADGLDQQIQALKKTIIDMKNAAAQRRAFGARRKREDEENDIKDTDNQQRFIAQAELRAERPINPEAVKVLYALEDWIGSDRRRRWRVAFEVGMGAFIKTKDRQQNAAFSSYNSKRVDFLLIDSQGYPKLAVEYHGSGHALSDDASDRMAVKRLALDRAGIALLEIPEGTTRADLLRLITDKLGPNAMQASQPASRIASSGCGRSLPR